MTAYDQQPLTPRRGAIHIHTAYYDGSGSMKEILAAAEEAGLDFLVISDHHSPYAAQDGWQGWQRDGKILVMVGAELRSAEKHDILTLGPNLQIATTRNTSRDTLTLLKNLGASTFLAHPQGNRQFWSGRYRFLWQDWNLQTYDGLEVWSYMHDWVKGLSFLKARRMCESPGEFICGPDREILRHWDEQAQKRRVAGLGALDVHAKKFHPFLNRFFPWLKGGVLPYLHTFKAFSHWALVPEKWSGTPTLDLQFLQNALVKGRGWICREELGSGRDFRFELNERGRTYPSGSDFKFSPGQELSITLPEPATIKILCRGATVREDTASALTYIPDAPGEYRVEIFKENNCWILSNHIYLRR